MFAIVVDYYCWSKEKGKHTKPLYLGIICPPTNLYVFDEEHNSRSLRWENKRAAEKYFKKYGFDNPSYCYENARIEEVEICTH